jgi:hypothetical protein
MSRRAVATVVLAAALVAATACGAPEPTARAGARPRQAPATVEPTQTLVTMGSSGTVGEGLDAAVLPQATWPQRLFREAFPRATVLVNAAIEASSAASARARQLPLATEMRPDVVAMWFGTYEAVQDIPPAVLQRELSALVGEVQDLGARVLLADLPATDVPTAAYNRVIAAVAAARDVTLVPLRSEPVTMLDRPDATFLPDAAGQGVIAAAFADALSS